LIPEPLADYRPTEGLLEGRTVLVSGAGGAIGGAVSRAAAAHGATVVLLGRDVPRLEALYDHIAAQGHPEPAIYPMDLQGALPRHYEELGERLAAELGGLHGLVHGAGMLGTLTSLERYDPEIWSQVMQVNLHAAFLLTRGCLPLLKRAADASVVFTTAPVGRRARAYWGAYGVSLAGVECMARTMAEELEATSRVRVNTLDPGPVRSRLRAQAYPGEEPGTLAPAERVASAYLYLLGPESRAVHGQALCAR